MIPRPTSGISNINRALQINTLNIKVLIIQILLPHARPRLAVAIIFSRGVDTDRNIQLFHNSSSAFFEIRETLGIASSCFDLLLDADFLLVGHDDDVVAGSH